MGTNRFGLVSAQVPSAVPIAQGQSSQQTTPTPAPGGAGLGGSAPRPVAQPAYRGEGMSTGFRPGAGGPIQGVDIAGTTGVNSGDAPQQNAVQQAQSQGPDLAAIQAEMQRRQVGAQLNQNPQNSALSGYLMG